MSLFYQMVFALLVTEGLCVLLLLLPLPLTWRKSLFKSISSSKTLSKLKSILNIALVFVCILFIDSVNKAMEIRKESKDSSHSARNDSYIHAKMFYAQRNVYLTGSTIFLALILNRFYYMVLELLKNEEKALVLKEQAAKTSKEYMKLLDGDATKEEQLEALKKELQEAQNKAKELDIVKKQAERTAEEYMALTDRYVALERKVEGRTNDAKKDK